MKKELKYVLMAEPLKGKIHHVQTNARIDDAIPMGQTCYLMIHAEHLKERVEWLKAKIQSEGFDEYCDTTALNGIIDEAFEDVIEK